MTPIRSIDRVIRPRMSFGPRTDIRVLLHGLRSLERQVIAFPNRPDLRRHRDFRPPKP